MDFRPTEAEIAVIADGARTLLEQPDAPLPPEIEAQWRQTVARGNDEDFRRLRAWRGRPAAASLPWLDDFRTMCAAAEQVYGASDGNVLHPTGDPALDPWIPVVEAAARTGRERLRAMNHLPAAMLGLERRLLGLFGKVSLSASTEIGMVADASQGGSPPAWLRPSTPMADFPRQLFIRYPALARGLTILWRDWIDATAEFLDRLRDDATELAGFLGVSSLPPIVALDGDGDPHNGGRSVIILTLGDGARLVYKPRPLALDAAFGCLLDWVNTHGPFPALRHARVLDRGAYGWAEFITHRPVEPDQEQAFWHRAGLLSGLAHVLNATDLHHENVIFDGTCPVLIDLETVIQPHAAGGRSLRPLRETAEAADWAGLDIGLTGLLPQLLPVGRGDDAESVRVDVGAFSATAGAGNANRTADTPPEPDLLRHGATIREGAAAMLSFLRDQRAPLLASGGPLAGLAALTIRYVFRDTNVYYRLARISCHATHMRNGMVRDIALDQLARPVVRAAAAPVFLPVIDAERRALSDMDIPFFLTTADSLDLRDRHGVVCPNMFGTSAGDALRQRLQALDEAHIGRQCDILDLTIQSRIAHWPGGAAAGDAAGATDPLAEPLAGARAIGAALAEAALWVTPKVCAWRCLRHHAAQDILEYAGPTAWLGEGAAGIALFLTHLTAVDDGADLARARDGAMAMVEAAALGLRALPRVDPGRVGLMDGAAGVALVLALCGRALHRPGHVAMAVDLVRWAAEQRDAADVGPSLARGLAGLVLAATGVARIAGTRDLDEAIARWAAILADRQDWDVGAGLLAGRAGISLALARAGRHLADPTLLRAAEIGGDGAGGWIMAALTLADAGRAPPAALPAIMALAEVQVPDTDGLARGAAGLAIILRAALRRADTLAMSSQQRARVAGAAQAAEGRMAGKAVSGRLTPITPALPGVLSPGLLHGIAGAGLALLSLDGADALGFA